MLLELSNKIDRLEGVPDNVKRYAAAPSGVRPPLDRRIVVDLLALLQDLADRLDRLQMLLPGLEGVLDRPGLGGWPEHSFPNLPQYLQNLGDRLDALRYSSKYA